MHPDVAVSSTQHHIQDSVKEFYKEMANWVMCCMDQYYQHASNRNTCIRKISNKMEYKNLARQYSQSLRRVEKETYMRTNGTYDGLQMNLDMKDRVKMIIDKYFEGQPLLPLD